MKKELVAFVKKTISALVLIIKIWSKDNSDKEKPKFCEFEVIEGVNYLHLGCLKYGKYRKKDVWLCLELPDGESVSWEEGKEWCESKGGNYGDISTWNFIWKNSAEINDALQTKSYREIEDGLYWSVAKNDDKAFAFNMDGIDDVYSKKISLKIRAILYR